MCYHLYLSSLNIVSIWQIIFEDPVYRVGINVTTNKAPVPAEALGWSSAKQEFHPICQCPKRGRTKFHSLVPLDGCLISNSSCHYICSRSFRRKWSYHSLPNGSFLCSSEILACSVKNVNCVFWLHSQVGYHNDILSETCL